MTQPCIDDCIFLLQKKQNAQNDLATTFVKRKVVIKYKVSEKKGVAKNKHTEALRSGNDEPRGVGIFGGSPFSV